MKHTQLVVDGVIIRENKILLTKRNEEKKDSKFQDLWQLPGGGHEFGETPEQTLHRELKEECGIDVIIKTLFPKIYTEARSYWQGMFIIYICEMKDPTQPIILNEESNEYIWCDLNDLAGRSYMPMLENALSEISEFVKNNFLFNR